MKNNATKNITKDISFINNEISKFNLDEKLNKRIKKFVFSLKAFLSEDYILKKIGSYAMEGIFNFEDKIVVDVLVLKYINRDFYKRYFEIIESENHFLDCLCCFHTKIIFQKLNELFDVKDHVIIEMKKNKDEKKENNIKRKSDSILIRILDQTNNTIFSVNIRVGICSKELPVIICDQNIYHYSYAIQVVQNYNILNNLLNKKMKYLFMIIKKTNLNEFSKKNIMFSKLKIISDIEMQLSNNDFMPIWLNKVYKLTLNNSLVLKKVLDKKNLHYFPQKFFNRIHKFLILKDLKWVFNNSYDNLENFIDYYLKYSQKNSDIEKAFKEQHYLYLYYDSSVYIDIVANKNFTVKKNNRLFDYIGIKKINRSVYPSEKKFENVVLFLQYFAMSFYIPNN